jgi:tetratricopeptide (TPR) repeat protein
VLGVLGQGAFGIVLEAFDEKLQRRVAVKVLTAQAANSPTARERFLREARAAAAIRNPHVVQVFEVAEGPVPYLVMEFVNGPTLQHQVDKHGPLDVPSIVRIGAQIATGLAAAHALGKIHRDIKPANILLSVVSCQLSVVGKESQPLSSLTTDNRQLTTVPKITDFGLARGVDDVRLTQSGAITGTPLFMSPEQARGEPLDHSTDLFSLGSVLYFLCTGQAPFRADRIVGVLKRVCEDTPQPIRELNPNVPDWLAAVVDKLLAKDRAARFQTAGEVADLLGGYLVHLSDPSLPLPEAPDFSTPASHRPLVEETTDHAAAAPLARRPRPLGRWLFVCGMAIVLLGIGFVAGSLLRPAPANPEQGQVKVVGRQEQARLLLEQALAELPDNEAAAGALAELMLADNGHPKEGTGDAASETEALRTEVRKANLRGFAALGAARLVQGNPGDAAEALTRAAARPDAGTAELLLLALTEQQRKRPEQARQPYEKALKGIQKRPLDGLATLLARRAMIQIEGLSIKAADYRLRTWADAHELAALTVALGSNPTKADEYLPRATWFAGRGRWKEAARDNLARVELDARDIHGWLEAAGTTLLAGDVAGYRRLCGLMTPLIENPIQPWETEVVCKVWLLHPGKLDGVKVALGNLQKAVKNDEGQDWLKPWLAGTQALAAYRAGDYAQAVECSGKVCQLGEVKPGDPGDRSAALAAMAFLVRAMAEQQRKHTEEATRYYDAAAALIPRELRTLGSSEYKGPLPVDARINDRDWFIAEILRREAELLLANPPR